MGDILDAVESARARDLHESLQALEACWEKFAVGNEEFGRSDGGDPALIEVRLILQRHGRIDKQGKPTG